MAKTYNYITINMADDLKIDPKLASDDEHKRGCSLWIIAERRLSDLDQALEDWMWIGELITHAVTCLCVCVCFMFSYIALLSEGNFLCSPDISCRYQEISFWYFYKTVYKQTWKSHYACIIPKYSGFGKKSHLESEYYGRTLY